MNKEFKNIVSKKLASVFLSCAAVFLASLLLTGCNLRSIVEPIVYAKQGSMSPNTEFAMFRISTDEDIRRELAGERFQFRPDLSWKAYWQLRYKSIRGLKNPIQVERDIAYIHQQRQSFGLPLYDDEN